MPNTVKVYSIPEKLTEEERLRLLAQRALAPPAFPFDGLHIEAATFLAQLGLVTERFEGKPKDLENIFRHCATHRSRS